MSKQTSPLVMVASFLMGIGLFSIFCPIFIKLLAPARAWASYQSYLLIGGLILLTHIVRSFSDEQIEK